VWPSPAEHGAGSALRSPERWRWRPAFDLPRPTKLALSPSDEAHLRLPNGGHDFRPRLLRSEWRRASPAVPPAGTSPPPPTPATRAEDRDAAGPGRRDGVFTASFDRPNNPLPAAQQGRAKSPAARVPRRYRGEGRGSSTPARAAGGSASPPSCGPAGHDAVAYHAGLEAGPTRRGARSLPA